VTIAAAPVPPPSGQTGDGQAGNGTDRPGPGSGLTSPSLALPSLGQAEAVLGRQHGGSRLPARADAEPAKRIGDAVRALGIIPELISDDQHSSAGLLDTFPEYDDVLDPVDRVLLPRADIATETLAEELQSRGWEIDDVTAYRTVRAAPPPAPTREAIKTGGFDAVCFTSSSTVRNLVGIAGKPHARTIVACIGPKTAETAAEFGVRVDVQPETAAVGPLIEALAEHAARLRAEGALPPPRKKSRRR